MTRLARGEASEVQSAAEIAATTRWLLEHELDRPAEPAAIGGLMCWLYDIDEPVLILRRAQIESLLGRTHKYESDKIKEAAVAVFEIPSRPVAVRSVAR